MYIQALLNRLLQNKMSTTSVRELGYLFLFSLHIIASDLDVQDRRMERIYAYMEKTQRGSWRNLLIHQETQKCVCISPLIIIQNLKILSKYTVWDRLTKKPSHATVPLKAKRFF
jgi:hypothetical protein